MKLSLSAKVALKTMLFVTLTISGTTVLYFVSGQLCNCDPTTGKPVILSGNNPSKPDTRPGCKSFYAAHQGETQYQIAKKFANVEQDKEEWLKSMRYMSHKAPDDLTLHYQETVCVEWMSQE